MRNLETFHERRTRTACGLGLWARKSVSRKTLSRKYLSRKTLSRKSVSRKYMSRKSVSRKHMTRKYMTRKRYEGLCHTEFSGRPNQTDQIVWRNPSSPLRDRYSRADFIQFFGEILPVTTTKPSDELRNVPRDEPLYLRWSRIQDNRSP